MKSPCIGCHLEREDKNNSECMNCRSRRDYARSLGGMTHSVPERLTDAVRFKTDNAPAKAMPARLTRELAVGEPQPREEDKPMKTTGKICSKKDCAHAGRPQPLANFHKNARTPDGLSFWCKDCAKAYAKKVNTRKKKPSASVPGSNVAADRGDTDGRDKEKGVVKNKLLDLNNHLFAQLERLTDESTRGDHLAEEIMRSKSITAVAGQIIGNARLALDAQVAINDGLIKSAPAMIGVRSHDDV